MREALQSQRNPSQGVLEPFSVPAPFGGWSTRDPIAAMPETDAVLCDNFVVYPSITVMRKGATDHSTAYPGSREVETLMVYKSQNGTGTLFAATSVGIYNATSAGAVGASVVVATNARWQYVNFTNSAGSWLICLNGADSMQQWNGSAWTAVAALGTVNTNTLVAPCVYKERLYFVPSSELAFYYLGAGAITGTATKFNLGQVTNRGGYLVAMATWSVDAGDGLDDMLVCVTSEGEVVVYQGDDPGNAATWSLVGNFYIGKPIGRRCLTKYAGDLLMICDQGIIPISSGLQSSTVDRAVAISDKIQPTLLDNTTLYGANFGWETILDTQEAFLLVNMPGTTPYQYVMGLQSKGWSRFTGWDANCFAIKDGVMYYGTTGKVVKCYFGNNDFGSAIQSDLVPAFNYFGARGRNKQLSVFRPTFVSDGPFGYTVGACMDFVVTLPSSGVSLVTTGASIWDAGLWDIALWVDQAFVTKNWRTIYNKPWFAFAPYIRLSSANVRAGLVATDYQDQPGYRFLVIPLLGSDSTLAEWVFERSGGPMFPVEKPTTVGVWHKGAIVAGAAFHTYNGANIWVDIAIENPFAARLLFTLIGRYAFNQLRCSRLTMAAVSDNLQAIKLHERLGGISEGRLVAANPDGNDILISRLTPDSYIWRKLNGKKVFTAATCAA